MQIRHAAEKALSFGATRREPADTRMDETTCSPDWGSRWFFPDLEDTEIQELCTQIITLGNQNVFESDAWYSSTSVPYALFYKDGIGIYPYFAIGDWEHFCIIPVTENTIQPFEEKGVLIYEIG